MQLDRAFDDGQAQPGARYLAAVAGAEEAFEQAWNVFGGQAYALVGDYELNFFCVHRRFKAHHAAFGRILDGVG